MELDLRTRRNELIKARYARLKEQGLCTKCDKPAKSGKTLCESCLQKQTMGWNKDERKAQRAKYMRERKERLIAQGLCTRCAIRPARNNRKQCEECTCLPRKEYTTSAEQYAKYAKRVVRWRNQLKQEGMCTQCANNPAVAGQTRCDLCIQKEKLRCHTEEYKQRRVPIILEQRRDNRIKLKCEVVSSYGGYCRCCGESSQVFLTIDHVHNNGAEERKDRRFKTTEQLYRFLRRNGFPQERYQLLCWNCNCGKGGNRGVCPHISIKDRSDKYRARLKAKVIEAYGGKCQCCGEVNQGFLTIDHINNDGSEERKDKSYMGNNMYRLLKKNNYPKDRYQLLCFNCNSAKHLNGGICPHVEPKLQ